MVGEVIRARPFGTFEFVAALAFVDAIIIGVNFGLHKEDFARFIAFLLMYGIAFVVMAQLFCSLHLSSVRNCWARDGPLPMSAFPESGRSISSYFTNMTGR